MNEESNFALRAIQIFELFAHIKRSARVNEIHEKLNQPQSSTSKLLKLLANRGYVEYDQETRTYIPTLRVTVLGNWLRDESFGSRALMNVAEDLRQQFGRDGVLGTSVVIGVQNDTHVMYVLELPIIDRPRPPLSVGMLRPLCAAGVGKALMMIKTDEEIGLLIRRINSETVATEDRIDPHLFIEEMRISRERGFALSQGGVHADAGAVAVPLPQIPHQPRMALGLGANLDVLEEDLDNMVAALVEKRDFLFRSTGFENGSS